jgi:hypothetical protein
MAGDLERHSEHDEASSPARENRFGVAGSVSMIIGVSEDIGVSEASEVDETSLMLEIARGEIFRFIAWSKSIIDDSERHLEADKASPLPEIAREDAFVMVTCCGISELQSDQ